ncbi:RNA polymerase sigma factor [Cellulomonas xylanilytica]|uniref:RNA polymerase sigma factor n=1 Tax=Cellulomonas xylanilytica TaxID=233583 RepID=A0A510V7X6_9CELL|nr:sigma-70 family RNA polymerase sigma factor [Cellulomonas xylanilytica]GEK22977.1 RNA polymerase sigma factor [Cellulomonas xylanilytica]
MAAWEQVLEEVLRDRRSALVGYAALFTLDRGDAEDLAHDAIIRTFAKRRALTDVFSAEGYVRAVIRTMYIDSTRRSVSWRAKVHLLAETGHAPSPERATEAVLDVRAALAGLAPRERAVAVLRFFDDLTVPEIAHELDLSTGAVKRYLSDATAKLRSVLGPDALPDETSVVRPVTPVRTGRSEP